MTPTIINGDCLEVMAGIETDSIDAIVTDPPYGLGFMGRAWDELPPGLDWAEACLRVLKPGGHLVAFGGTRTWHRLAVAVEDAGFEIRDSLAWLYGSGFPKSQNVGKMIDKKAGAAREVTGHYAMPADSTAPGKLASGGGGYAGGFAPSRAITAPATPDAAKWDGWGTALKPAFEPIILARKPFKGTVAGNVLAHGTGAINIDACRVGMSEDDRAVVDSRSGAGHGTQGGYGGNLGQYHAGRKFTSAPAGRWPANVILDEHTAELVDEQSGVRKSGSRKAGVYRGLGYMGSGATEYPEVEASEGGASRFFYSAKAPKRERPDVDGVKHPTVKPPSLMEWLLKLVTPDGGTVLDPFAGSGTTLEAAKHLGINAIGIERETEYIPLIQHRLERTYPR